MLDFRKVLLALSVAGIGLVSTASAQITCTGLGGFSAAGAGTIRSEGLAEQLPVLTLAGCSGTTNTATVSFTVTTNAPIGNVALTGTTNNSVDAIANFPGLPPVAASGGVAIATVVGQVVNSTTIQFTFATPTAVVVAAGTTITISNVRVNASAVPSGTQITATIAPVSGFTSMNTSAASLAASAAFTAPTLTTSKLTTYNNVAICSTTTSSVNVVATVQIFENFVGALTTAAQELIKESVNGVNGITANPAPAALTGTTIAIVFNNLVSGVNYYVPTTVIVPTPPFGGLGTFQLNLVSGPTSTAPIVGGSIGAAGATGFPGGTVAGVAQIASTSGSATVYYQVAVGDGGVLVSTVSATNQNSTTLPTTLGTFVNSAPGVLPVTTANGIAGMINLYEVVPTSVTVGTTTTLTASVFLASNVATSYPQFVAVTAPAVLTTKTGLLSSCNTTLIFPYVLTSSGYDTGIELGNTAPGSSVTGNTVSTTANGSCTMTAFGTASFGGTAITPFALSNSPLAIASGTVNAFTLSTGLPATVPTFVGYLIATCNFQAAHGFGFVFGGAGGNTNSAGLSYGYLAPILSDVFAGVPGPVQNLAF
jgi:hypothetical protein